MSSLPRDSTHCQRLEVPGGRWNGNRASVMGGLLCAQPPKWSGNVDRDQKDNS